MLLKDQDTLVMTSNEVIAYYTRLSLGEDCAAMLNQISNRQHSNAEWLGILRPSVRQAFYI